MDHYINTTLDSLEIADLKIQVNKCSAGCFISAFKKTDKGYVGLGSIQVMHEGMEATLFDERKITVPYVKLNTFQCPEELLRYVPQIEEMLTTFLNYINSNPQLVEPQPQR